MRTKYKTTALISLDLECLLQAGESLPDAQAALQAMLAAQPLIAHASIHDLPPWRQGPDYWQTLEETPCESGDLVIHACRRGGIGRTLLAECVREEAAQSPLRAAYLPNAEDEEVERAVYLYLRSAHPGYRDGFYPCPALLAARFHGANA